MIKELLYTDKLTMVMLHGTLTAYEVMTEKGKLGIKEEKNYLAMEGRKHMSQEDSSHGSNEEEDKSFRSINKGTRNFKFKLPFKCFRCGRIG